MSKPRTSREKRGNGTALLLVDFLNPLDFTDDRAFIRRALAAARAAHRLRARLDQVLVPAIYVNDHWGNWTQSIAQLVTALARSDVPGRGLVELLAPRPTDFTLLKPRHSGFYGTALQFLLEELRVSRLILTGLAANNCVLFTAHDAYIRQYEMWIPSDCVAAERESDRRAALTHMRAVLKAKVAPSSDFLNSAAIRASHVQSFRNIEPQ